MFIGDSRILAGNNCFYLLSDPVKHFWIFRKLIDQDSGIIGSRICPSHEEGLELINQLAMGVTLSVLVIFRPAIYQLILLY